MAKKKKGVFGALGNLVRWTIYGLAAVLLVAIYLNWSGDQGEEVATAPAGAENAAEEGGAEADAPEETASVETADAVESVEAAAAETEAQAEAAADAATAEVEAAADAADAEIDAAADAAGTEADAAAEEVEQGLEAVTDEVREAAGEFTDAVEDAMPEDEAVEAAEPVVEAVPDEAVEEADRPGPDPSLSDAPGAEGALPDSDAPVELPTEITEFTIPGDEGRYALQNAFVRDDGAIEFTTERTGPDGVTQTVTRLITCAPLASGLIAEGDGARIDNPDMERLVLGSPEASLAALACGVFR